MRFPVGKTSPRTKQLRSFFFRITQKTHEDVFVAVLVRGREINVSWDYD